MLNLILSCDEELEAENRKSGNRKKRESWVKLKYTKKLRFIPLEALFCSLHLRGGERWSLIGSRLQILCQRRQIDNNYEKCLRGDAAEAFSESLVCAHSPSDCQKKPSRKLTSICLSVHPSVVVFKASHLQKKLRGHIPPSTKNLYPGGPRRFIRTANIGVTRKEVMLRRKEWGGKRRRRRIRDFFSLPFGKVLIEGNPSGSVISQHEDPPGQQLWSYAHFREQKTTAN